ncbi:MAG TPA: nuclear transport factor 2 family protein [Acidimicrobiales bacterium]|nr:nuclear transport factor 2 family protein [Acidimicrobiales bacterium]
MGAEDNARLVRRGYEAFSAGDMATLTELFPEDAVWHLPGKGGLAGDKRGRDAVFGYFGELMSRSGGTLKITLHDVIGGEQHTIGLHHDDAVRDGRVLNHNVVLVVHVTDGRLSEVWELHEDQANNDAFWS